MFTKGFGTYACDGDTITCTTEGFDCTATIHRDDDSEAPWEREDGHGPVTDWMPKDAKRAGYRVLNVDRDSVRFYDFAEAVKIARRDGWDSEPFGVGTAGERAARAAEQDFKVLKAWCDDKWTYCGIVVTASRAGVELGSSSLWGVECNYPDSDNGYLMEVANEELDEAITDARIKLTELCA